MSVGDLVYDWALGMNGIVVDGAFTEETPDQHHTQTIDWEWNVLYEDGELQGADTRDIKVVE